MHLLQRRRRESKERVKSQEFNVRNEIVRVKKVKFETLNGNMKFRKFVPLLKKN